MMQKAVEMGVSSLRPVATRRTQVTRINGERMHANAVEAAEQCGILTIPEVLPIEPLSAALARLSDERLLVFCDEDADPGDAVDLLRSAASRARSVAVLVGPEGGFDPVERAEILARSQVIRLSLGPRILRADTAAVAVLTLVQAVIGDWQTADHAIATI